MTSEWDEIRKLAADLQRAQLSGSIQKLSERCVDFDQTPNLLIFKMTNSCTSMGLSLA